MDSIILAVVLLVITLVFYCLQKYREPANSILPNGPTGVPILGQIPFMKPRGYLTVHRIAQRFGELVYIRMGFQRIYILSSLRVIKEVLCGSKGDIFSGRIHSKFNDNFHGGQGILFIDGPIWRIHRAFALKVLKGFGMGSSLAETIAQSEAKELVKIIDTCIDENHIKNDVSLNLAPIFSRSVINVISVLTMSDRLSVSDPHVYDALIGMLSASRNLGPTNNIPSYIPFIGNYFGPFLKFIPVYQRTFHKIAQVRKKVQSKLEELRSEFIEIEEPNNYICAFLAEQRRLQNSGEANNTFTDAQLCQSVIELFLAGTDTTSSTLTWGVLFLCLHREIQHKVHEEIKMVYSNSVTMSDRKHYNYTLAVLDEISRCASLVPIMPHRNVETARITSDQSPTGYFDVPSDTVCWVNLYSILHDPQVWEKPDQFYPEHFIDISSGKYQKRDELIPFALGKRSCLGEALAKMELFIFFVELFARFDFALDTTSLSKTELEQVLMGPEGIVRCPGNFNVIVNKLEM